MIGKRYGSVVAFHKGVPKAEVYVIDPRAGKKTRYAAIVDTGADHLQLDTAAAGHAGLNYSALPGITVTTAGGSVVLKQGNITIELQGVQVTVPALFGNTPAGALLGRSALLRALEVAFDQSNWGYKIPSGSGTPATPASSPTAAQGTQASSLAWQGPSSLPPRIVDHETWLDIGGVRVEKRVLLAHIEQNRDEKQDVRSAAVEALAETNCGDAVERLDEILRNKDAGAESCIDAIRGLGNSRNPEAISCLEETLQQMFNGSREPNEKLALELVKALQKFPETTSFLDEIYQRIGFSSVRKLIKRPPDDTEKIPDYVKQMSKKPMR